TFNWYDAITGQESPYDDLGHGTHTTGTMVGSEPNGTNQIGVAPGAKWIAVKAFSSAGASVQDLLRAGEWVLAPKDAQGNPHPEKAPDVVNNSWGGGKGIDEWFRPMVINWRAADIFPNFSSGNTGPGDGSVSVPGNYPESFAVGATMNSGNLLAGFSSRGPSPYGEVKPDISAPGVAIRSSIPGGKYTGMQGTSMSAPAVAGVVALIKQANASLTVDDIEDILLVSAKPLTDSNYPTSPNNGYGYGLVNAYSAISAIVNGIGRVQGQVVREGQDTENPTYQHTAPTELYANMTLPLTIQVQDNVNVRSVELQYRASESAEWQTVAATRTAGDYKSGTYQAVIPDAIQAQTLTYYWRITDYGQNVVTSDHYAVPVKSGISTGYNQDFESQPNGWISYGFNNSWEWGVPASGPAKAASGEKVYGTNLEGNYDNYANMSLMMPPIVLPEGNTYLQFKDWYSINNFTDDFTDYGHVLVSIDKQNWQQLSRFTGKSETWTERQIDLSAYAGKQIYIAFNVTSDGINTSSGWYIDDVALSTTSHTTANVELEDIQHQKLLASQLENKLETNKREVNPETIQPTNMQNVMAPTATITPTAVQPMTLPLEATVSVLESGRSVATNPSDGSYTLMSHPVGEFTLRAETYGYYSADQRVNISKNGTVEANFTLNPIPKGTVSGTVTNKQTGQPIANATL
ncbi:S8 family serine peptidase, partial [Bacillus sp. 7884-1]|uniref:S8 family serine peptidase n=1 Tax=Bacillus sp. 7884-1 TaxID=2021693 RepID=UPI000BD71EBB